MNRVHSFRGFAQERVGKWLDDWQIVETCLQAMQEGALDVCAQNEDGQYVWMCYGMMANHWRRACGLLQRAGIPSSILWDEKRFTFCKFMAEIEYFWTDLDAAQRYLECRNWKPAWVLQELGWRLQEWRRGFRRAWLAACTV